MVIKKHPETTKSSLESTVKVDPFKRNLIIALAIMLALFSVVTSFHTTVHTGYHQHCEQCLHHHNIGQIIASDSFSLSVAKQSYIIELFVLNSVVITFLPFFYSRAPPSYS